MEHRLHRRTPAIVLTCALSTAVLGMAGLGGVALGVVVNPGVATAAPAPPDNPASNYSPPYSGWSDCAISGGQSTCANPCITLSSSDQFVVVPNAPLCVQSVLQAIDTAHASEGIAPVTLPTNWFSLTTAEQLFTITDLERVALGETPYVGLVSALNADAQAGANANSDPAWPAVSGVVWYGSIWAGGFPGALASTFMWMYDDGYGGPNIDCTTPSSSGCWGHRDNILTAPLCSLCYVGAAAAPGNSYAEVFVGTDQPLPCTFTWDENVAPYLPGGIVVLPDGNLASTSSPPVALLPAPVVGMASTPSGNGYWIVDAQGYVDAYGSATNYGGMGGDPLNAPISHIVSTPDGKGYWLVAADGGVFSFGDAQFYGSMGGHPLNAPVMDIIPTQDGGGYWLVATDGGIFSFGNARFYGSMGGHPLNAPVNGGSFAQGGYRMVANDGGIFDFGGAQFYGSTGGHPLNEPIVGMADTPDGAGYWLVASDGGIFSFGDAQFYGSAGSSPPSTPVVGMAVDDATGGYWIVDQAGQVFGYNAPTLAAA